MDDTGKMKKVQASRGFIYLSPMQVQAGYMIMAIAHTHARTHTHAHAPCEKIGNILGLYILESKLYLIA